MTAAQAAASRIAAAAFGFRIASAILALFIVLAFPIDRDAPAQATVWGQASPFWDAFARHDSGWYVDIAKAVAAAAKTVTPTEQETIDKIAALFAIPSA